MRSKQNRLSRPVADFDLVRSHSACDTIDRHIIRNRTSAVFGLCQARRAGEGRASDLPGRAIRCAE
jgi:hypothetical protein